METASWEDAVAFCRKLSEKEGKDYRLPTEAEWEYACRAGTTTPFGFGSILNGEQANCDGGNPYGTSTKGPYKKETAAGGSYRPNAFGLHDMHGNVSEWCEDWYDAKYYEGSPSEYPAGPASGSIRVSRGGNWFCGAGHCRASFRLGRYPGVRYDDQGFRVATTVSSSSPSR
jgi:formylglycine-generating enzyme required for sulfatase activity